MEWKHDKEKSSHPLGLDTVQRGNTNQGMGVVTICCWGQR